MAKDIGCAVKDLVDDDGLRRKIDITNYATEYIGIPTLTDIMNELEKPGRDPREQFMSLEFAEGINEISDLRPGMKVPGVVTNVTAFGAFIDIGVHQNGLVHISHMADHYVKDPRDIVKVNQRVMVTVLNIDLERKRISLSMKNNVEKSTSP
jgi:uncharacterized protein